MKYPSCLGVAALKRSTIYLASGSAGRKALLSEAGIDFQVVQHTADESVADLSQPLEQIVIGLAQEKMQHVIIPDGLHEDQEVFVLTADTLTLKHGDDSGSVREVMGKPKDRRDAERMIKLSRYGSTTGTGFCVQKRVWKNGAWSIVAQHVGYDEAWVLIDIPDAFIDFYLDRIPFQSVSGAISVLGFCEQFTKEIRGSVSTIKGMPMYQLREALYAMGFYR